MIRVGTEFEFVVAFSETNKIINQRFTRLSNISTSMLQTLVGVNPTLFQQVVRHYQYHQLGKRFDDIDPYDFKPNNILDLIARYDFYKSLKLYTRSGDQYVPMNTSIFDRLEKLNKAPESFIESIKEFILSDCWIKVPTRNGWDAKRNFYKKVFKTMIKHFNKVLGVKIRPLKYHGETFDPKITHGWYITEDSIDDESFDYSMNHYMIELITPPMTPTEMRVVTRKVFKALRQSTPDFSFVTTEGCGVHFNISHRTYDIADYSQTYLGMMLDDEFWMKKFNRYQPNNYESLRDELKTAVRNLKKTGLLTLSDLDKEGGFKFAVDLIDSVCPASVFRSVNYDSVNQYRFLEHRCAGGKDYQYELKNHLAYLDELISVTKTYPSRYENLEFKQRLIKFLTENDFPQDISISKRIGPAKYLHGTRHSPTDRP